MEKYIGYENNLNIKEVFKKASNQDTKNKFYKSLRKLNFIEFPKLGFKNLEKIIKIISKLGGCILMIDYGYIKSNNKNTLQSVIQHRKNNILRI